MKQKIFTIALLLALVLSVSGQPLLKTDLTTNSLTLLGGGSVVATTNYVTTATNALMEALTIAATNSGAYVAATNGTAYNLTIASGNGRGLTNLQSTNIVGGNLTLSGGAVTIGNYYIYTPRTVTSPDPAYAGTYSYAYTDGGGYEVATNANGRTLRWDYAWIWNYFTWVLYDTFGYPAYFYNLESSVWQQAYEGGQEMAINGIPSSFRYVAQPGNLIVANSITASNITANSYSALPGNPVFDYETGQIGVGANGGSDGTAIGNGANGSDFGTAIGESSSGATLGAAIGYSAQGGNYGAAVGSSAYGYGYGNVAIGYFANANPQDEFNNTVQLGAGTATVNGGLHFRDWPIVDGSGMFTGNGGGLTNLQATNIVGLNFGTGDATIGGNLTVSGTNTAGYFTGDGAGVSNVVASSAVVGDGATAFFGSGSALYLAAGATLTAAEGSVVNFPPPTGNGGGVSNVFFMQEVGSVGNTGTSSLSTLNYGTNEVIAEWPAFTSSSPVLTEWYPVTNTLNSVITEPQKIKPPNPMFEVVNGCQLKYTNTSVRFFNFAATFNFRQTNSSSASREIRFRLVKISDQGTNSSFTEYPITRSVIKATVSHNAVASVSFNSVAAVAPGERLMFQAAMGAISSVIVHDCNVTATTTN